MLNLVSLALIVAEIDDKQTYTAKSNRLIDANEEYQYLRGF